MKMPRLQLTWKIIPEKTIHTSPVSFDVPSQTPWAAFKTISQSIIQMNWIIKVSMMVGKKQNRAVM
jgi:hypothetical protein